MVLDIPTGRIDFPLEWRQRAIDAAERGQPCFDATRQRLAVAWIRRSGRLAFVGRLVFAGCAMSAATTELLLPSSGPVDTIRKVAFAGMVATIAGTVLYRRGNPPTTDPAMRAMVEAANIWALLADTGVPAAPLAVRRAWISRDSPWPTIVGGAFGLSLPVRSGLVVAVLLGLTGLGVLAHVVRTAVFPYRLRLGPDGLTLPGRRVTVPWRDVRAVTLIPWGRLQVAWKVHVPALTIVQTEAERRLTRLLSSGDTIAVRAYQLREPPELVAAVSQAWIATARPRPEEPAAVRW